MSKGKIIRLTTALVIIFSMLIPVNLARGQSGPAEDIAGGLEDNVEITLHADGAPLPGGSTQLSLEVTPLIEAPNLEIRWVIPEGVQLLGAEVDTYPDAAANQPVQSVRILHFPQAGTYKIAVSVRLLFGPDTSSGTAGVLFFVIDPNGSRVTDMDPEAKRPASSGPSNQVTITSEPSSSPRAPNEDPCFTIFVHAERIDYPVTTTGFGPAVIIPMAGIGIEFRESDLMFDDSYGTLTTDASGNLVGSFCDDDGLLDDTLEIYMRITAQRGDPIVYVEDSSWIDEIYEYDTDIQESSGGTLNFNITLGDIWSGIFNIVDAGIMAREVWVNSGGEYDEETEIHWEPGYGDDKSYYDGFYNEITIADDPSDPDQWDEAIILHEWGHSADDYYSCDDNPGGDHAPGIIIDSELAWGEGYPTYYSSVVRDVYGDPNASWMIDIDGSGVPGNLYNLEFKNYPVDVGNQGSISAALWDLYDDEQDFQDIVHLEHAAIQGVYTSNEFMEEAYGVFDDTCNFETYMRGWVDAGMPADRNTAAVILDNTGYTLAPDKRIAGNLPGTLPSTDYSAADIYRWWKQLTYVADNSLSMNGPKFEAMKTLFEEAVNDLGEDPEGTEFTLDLFNNTISTNDSAFVGQFFPGNLIGPIDSLTTIPDADPNCEVNALRALAQAVDDKEKGDVWLFTDGDTTQSPSVENIRQLLSDNRIRASIALMGICQKAENSTLTGPFSTAMLEGLTAQEQQSLMAERLLPGGARDVLGLMADDIPGGLVPYLLTALNSGGQFLYVDSSQAADAADILRAQISNSAGAGRWSDYVSDQPTYTYDELASWEYNWIDATAGTNRGNPGPTLKLDVPIPSPYFPFYDSGPYSTMHVFEDGYVTFGNHIAYQNVNTTLPNPVEPNNALYPYWDNMEPYCIPTIESSSPNCDMQGWIYTLQQGDWYALEFFKYQSYTTGSPLNTFEILFNQATGEIRYQYQTVPNGAVSATIGLENNNGSNGLQISKDDDAGASDGMGYKMIPVPPQPSKTFTVNVDSSMESVGFLLTGYSGSFEPLAVTDPNGILVNCSDPGNMCLNLDLVQYVQVNTNGRFGDWQAVVDAGSSGAGTFSFTSMATSPIAVESTFDHTLSTGSQQLMVQVTGQVDGCVLSGHFHRTNGNAFGNSFNFFDDGMHNDNRACDGLYGSSSFYPAGVGSGYLTLQGLHDGEAFYRIDPVPYTFQPFKVVSMGDGVNYGGVTQLEFQFTNSTIVDHCYWLSYDAPQGWWIDFLLFPLVCVDAGQTTTALLDVYIAAGYSNNLPSGTTGVLTLSATEAEKGEISDSASARITRHRQPEHMDVFNPTYYLRPNGDTAVIEYLISDAQNVVVADGTLVSFFATNGTVSPASATTVDGYVKATFTSGANIGTGVVGALTSNNVSASTEIAIGNPVPSQISLSISDNQLPADGLSTAELLATVRDRWGDPMPNQQVQIGVEGDGQLGTISGGEVVSGLTDANGQFSATLTSGVTAGATGIRAELIFDDGSGARVVHHDRKLMYIGIRLIHLPLIRR
jgi:hypothetical protein